MEHTQNERQYKSQHYSVESLSEKDPVCGMSVSPNTAESSQYNGKQFFFCSSKCKTKFNINPQEYIATKEFGKPINDSAIKGMEYTCPMHSQIRQTGPGNCPVCGMTLGPVGGQLPKGDDSEYRMILKRFWVSTCLSVPLLIITMGGRSLFHGGEIQKIFTWSEILLSSPVVVWGGFPFFDRFWKSLINRSPNMFTLIGLGVAVAYGYSFIAAL